MEDRKMMNDEMRSRMGSGLPKPLTAGQRALVEQRLRDHMDARAWKWAIFHLPINHFAKRISGDLGFEVTYTDAQAALRAISESGEYVMIAESEPASKQHPKGVAAAWASAETAAELTEEEIEFAVPYLRSHGLHGMGSFALDSHMERERRRKSRGKEDHAPPRAVPPSTSTEEGEEWR